MIIMTIAVSRATGRKFKTHWLFGSLHAEITRTTVTTRYKLQLTAVFIICGRNSSWHFVSQRQWTCNLCLRRFLRMFPKISTLWSLTLSSTSWCRRYQSSYLFLAGEPSCRHSSIYRKHEEAATGITIGAPRVISRTWRSSTTFV